MRIDPSATHPEDHLLASVLDALSDHVCVLDGEGRILAVNEAWVRFGVANGALEAATGVGSDYLAVCEAAARLGGEDEAATHFLAGLREVLAGAKERFALEYPCHSPNEQRWFVAKVSRVQGVSATRVVVAQDDVSALRQARTELEQALAALNQSATHFRLLFETLPVGVVYQDSEGRITEANPEALHLLGLSMDELCGRTSLDPRWSARREDGTDFDGTEHPAMVALRTGQPVSETLMQLAVPGRETAWLSIRAMPVLQAGRPNEVFTCFTDVTSRVGFERELRTLASEDALTGLLNRRRWMERLVDEHARFQRHAIRPYTLLSLDLDHFKQVNDVHGHAMGDAVLKHVAQHMRQTLRQSDVAGRLGGEEFAVLLPDTDLEAAIPLAERLRASLAQLPILGAAEPLWVTASVGLAQVMPQDGSHDNVMLRVDRALYAAKNGGRNRCEWLI